MKTVVNAILIIIAFLLQSTLFSRFTIAGITPNLILIVVASIGFLSGRRNGLIAGFFAGMLFDVFFGFVYGLYACIFMYIDYTNGIFQKLLFPNDIKLPLGLIVVSDILYGHVYYIFMFLFRGDLGYVYYLLNIILPEVVYTVVISCVLFPLIQTIYRKISAFEEKETDTIG